MNSKMQRCLDDMKKLLEENPDDFLNYLKECKERRYGNKGQTIKEFLETGIMYDHNLKDIDGNNVEDVDFDINGDIRIGQGYLARMKDSAREIIGDYDDNKE